MRTTTNSQNSAYVQRKYVALNNVRLCPFPLYGHRPTLKRESSIREGHAVLYYLHQ